MRKPIGTWIMRGGVCAVFATSLAFAGGVPTTAYADASQASSFEGTLTSAVSARVDESTPYVAYVTFNDNVTAKITFLEAGIFRYNVDLSGEFSNYATPRSKDHVAKIQAQPDSSGKYAHPKASTGETDTAVTVTDGTVTLSFEKATGKLTVLNKEGEVVFEESEALTITGNGTTQKLVRQDGENFFGGGTQNGRFLHTGDTIQVANTNNWVDGGVASPNPFYWTSDGYGVLRNTFAEGSYDFGDTDANTVAAKHADGEFDAYYFVSDDAGSSSTTPIAQDLLQDYFTVTGDPVLLPEYAFYLGHLNAYNRDGWSDTQQGGGQAWTIKGSESADTPATDGEGGNTTYEYGRGDGYVVPEGMTAESLNGPEEVLTESADNYKGKTPYEYSARAVIDEYGDNDMPLGWFLPNDGYGAGYGHNGYEKTGGLGENGESLPERLAAVDANVQNLAKFTEYANENGVETGLWTQSNLTPDSNGGTQWQKLRNFEAEVTEGGVSALKTDVAWVGSGYSFGLNGTKQAYDIVTTQAEKRPNIVTLDGWAGTQRFGGIWTGDQTGGNWEYIRFHIPTYIGQSLSGNPNIGSDMDGIFGGGPLIATRDYQWKTFTPLMLDMDGWGSLAKGPYVHGDPYTGISRMYLKLKSQLMPYIYTSAASAANVEGWTGNDDAGLPMIRAMLLEDDSEYAASEATQYQYMFGGDFLVAPVYQDTASDGSGNDIRNNIYLPGDSNDIWIDYWTGEQYRGGQVLNNYDAPLWKLPLFVKANAIVPMYEANNNPQEVTDSNPDGLDKTSRIVDFYPIAGDNSYASYEDDGSSITNATEKDEEYGTIDNINYNGHVETVFESSVKGDTATFTANASTGSYDGYDPNRSTTFKVSVSAKPESIEAATGDTALKLKEVDSKEAFDAAEPADGEAVYFYDESPVIETFAPEEEEKVAEMVKDVKRTPKVLVKFARADVAAAAQTLTIKGFENNGELPADRLNESLAAPADLAAPEDAKTPTSIKLTWSAVADATSYELKVDGTVFSVGDATEYEHVDLAYNSTHTYQVRSRNADGYSAWSKPELTTASLEDPWRNVPTPVSVDYAGGENWGAIDNAFDHDYNNMFHSSNGTEMGIPMTIDYGEAYALDKFVYTPRQDNGGNGNISQMKVEVSLDGTHWTDCGTHDWDNSGAGKLESKEVDLSGRAARYLRLTPLKSNSGHFSAAELALYKTDDSTSFEVGSTVNPGTVGSEDKTNLTNYLGVENRGNTKDTFDSQIAKGFGDINANGAYDVYDYAFTMFKLDGGTTKTDKVAGDIALIPSATSVKAGDEITVDLYASDASGVNAYGSLVHFSTDDFELVADSITQSPYTASMENLSIDKTFGDGTSAVNLAFANSGDKDLYSGTGVLASFKLRAKRDVDAVSLKSTSWLIGPTYDSVEVVSDGSAPELPAVPEPEAGEYGQDAFGSITITNDILSEDDGTNVSRLIQQKNYNGLFDGGETGNDFEFLWDVSNNWTEDGFLPDYVKLPTTMTFTFAQPSVLDNVEIVNRDGGNGTVTSMDAVITFEDGSAQQFSFDEAQDVFTLAVDADHAGKPVASVAITPKTSVGSANTNPSETDIHNRMLTLREINFNYAAAEGTVEGIELGENDAELYVGDLARVNASIKTSGIDYPYYTVGSSNPAVASVTSVADADGNIVWYVRGNAEGTATITVASALDSSVKETYEVAVKAGVNTSELVAAIQRAGSYSADAYTEDSFATLTAAVQAAEELIASEGYTANDVAAAVVAIEDAIDGLVMRPVDEETLINTSADSGVTALGASTSVEGKPGDVLDYDQSTYWHSTYAAGAQLPQWIMFDLGDEYDLTDVTFLPRQDGALRGDVFEFEVVTAASQEDLQAYVDNGYATPAGGSAVNLGTFAFDNDGHVINDRSEWKQASFGAQTTRYVMLVVTKSGGNDQGNDLYCNMAEVRFYGAKHEDPVVADKTALQELVDKIVAEDLKAEDYTEATWTPFENALADAQRLLSETDATQAEVDGALTQLRNAYDALETTEVPPIEKPSTDELAGAVDEAQKVDTSKLTSASAKALADAIAYAQDVLDDPNATEAQIKDAYDKLAQVMGSLEYKDEQGGEPGGGSGTGTEKPGDTGGSGNGGQTGGSGSGSGGTLAQTGDASLLGTIAAGISGLVAGGAGLFLHRRRRR